MTELVDRVPLTVNSSKPDCSSELLEIEVSRWLIENCKTVLLMSNLYSNFPLLSDSEMDRMEKEQDFD